MGKGRYYGLATQEEKQAVNIGSGVYPDTNGVLTYEVVATAIRNYKMAHPNFDDLSVSIAADRIAEALKKTGRYGNVVSDGAKIKGSDGYSIALTKGRGTDGMIILSRASEKLGKKKKK